MRQTKTTPQITPHKMTRLEELKRRIYQELYRDGEVPTKEEGEAYVPELAEMLGVEERIIVVAISFGELPHRYVSSDGGPAVAVPVAEARAWLARQSSEAQRSGESVSSFLLDRMPDGVVHAGSDSFLDDLNPFSAACQMIGVEEKDLADAISRGEVRSFEGSRGEVLVSGFEVAEWAGLMRGRYAVSVNGVDSKIVIEANSQTSAKEILARIHSLLPREMSVQLPVDEEGGKVSVVVLFDGEQYNDTELIMLPKEGD